jgi:hypothetical protein
MRYAALFVIAVTVLAFASTAGASVDLVASSIEFDQGEESAAPGFVNSHFSATMRWEVHRHGEETTVLQQGFQA